MGESARTYVKEARFKEGEWSTQREGWMKDKQCETPCLSEKGESWKLVQHFSQKSYKTI